MNNKSRFLLLILGLMIQSVSAQKLSNDSWMGYEKVNVTLTHSKAYYVRPKKALPGNPWVWRSSFPDWHIGMDTVLLNKGFHIGYVDFDDQYGSPRAMAEWDQFYRYMVNKAGLSLRPALEAISRGALYALAWAKRNPDKVCCIYAETPVYDIKSWPGGKGIGLGDPTSWKQLKTVFNLDEPGLLSYADNPFDNLEGLAAFKVPVLNVIGLQDQITPREENTDIFVKRYTALGGPAAIYPVTDGPQELHGHHFPVRKIQYFANFLAAHCLENLKILPYQKYFKTRGGIQDFYHQVITNKHATVGFLGGSITFNPGWRDRIIKYLKERFPQTSFTFISAGIPSLGSLPHAFRLKQDILDSGKVDLLFVEAAVNDRVNGTDCETQLKCLEGIVRHCKKVNSAMDIILMSFADPDKTRDYEKGIQPVEIDNHERVAKYYGLPSINLALAVKDKINNNEFNWNDDFKDLHPAVYGQELYAATIKDLLQSCFEQFTASELLPHNARMPPPLVKNSIINGAYYAVSHAQLGRGWQFEEKWVPKGNLGTRPGFVNMPVISSSQPGAELSMNFTGTAIGIAVVSGADAGYISYSIDNNNYKKVNLFTAWSGFLHLPWYILFNSDLTPGKHSIRVKIDSEKDKNSLGNACRIVHFLVNNG